MNAPQNTIDDPPGTPDAHAAKHAQEEFPKNIGRYRVEKVLGKGGFGLVYLAHDEQLQRLVAIKVPHRKLISRPEDAEAHLAEARTVASLDHPHIVPVYDVGGSDQFPCFIVSKYIDGTDLAARLKQSRLSVDEIVGLVATVAEALHHAHKQGLAHRDIKPGNILLDKSGKPFVGDFGLALREQDIGKGPGFAGTPVYMSPEQARGEGHRVDGRSDIFSLGVVLYELLTGRLPFSDDSLNELLAQITTFEPRPPRQIDDRIPKELDRICLKALSKRASDRYSMGKDFAEDLRAWSGTQDGSRSSTKSEPVVEPKWRPATDVGKDVFLSHASADKKVADNYCRLLEEQGIDCWIAPRDVPAGGDYGQAIIGAIETTVATVILFSTQANASIHVTHEVERATSKRKRVIPVRLEDVRPGPSLELHLSTAQWVDAWRLSPNQVVGQLALAVRDEIKKTASLLRPGSTSDQRPIKIVPKGLQSFDAHDADFFLELLPGPRDRDGLPDSLRFWKTRIEETDAESTFKVGLIYGPSGCGKSSLMKAGLLPRLSENVIAVYVEATAQETEIRLLNGLRKKCSALPDNVGLKDTLVALRQGKGIPAGKKVLIVLDQFEQWLHAKKEEQDTELVQALRQCDGGRVQCIVMVRDDFWMAVTRFLKEMEIRLVEGQNSAAADLFDLDHARKVLAAFGRAFGKLPENSGDTSKEQKEFLNQALSGLAQEGKVISVRLALFAEMMKGKSWNPASLKAVGGTEGVGVTFLEETFSASTASPEHRYHQKAARAVLRSSLPESGTDIKGHMRSYAELLEASGYASRPKDFDDLIRILDSEIRLIMPTDPEGKEEGAASALKVGEKYYQLTHDYLVPSLRDWLTRKQKETRQGRAELLLVDRAAVWNARQENRQLPSLYQSLQIRWLTAKKNWTPPQRKMMRQCFKCQALRSSLLALLLAVATVTALAIRQQVLDQHKATREQAEEKRNATHAAGLVQAVLNADTVQAPAIIDQMAPYRKWADPLLSEENKKATANTRQKLHASLALLPVDSGQVGYLYGRLLDAAPNEVPVIRDALASHKDALLEKLWAVVESPEKGEESHRLRAAAALAKYDPEGEKWGGAGALVVNDLVLENPVFLGNWSEAFRSVKNRLRPQLSEIFRDNRPERATERSLATNILADYAADDANLLADLLMNADEKQFAVIYPKFKDCGAQGLPVLLSEIDRKLPPDLPSSDESREKLAKRQANAAVALLRMNQPAKVWPLLQHSPDPRVRSYLIHRLSPLGADAKALIKRLDDEADITIRRALLLSLGEFGEKDISSDDRAALLLKLQEMYQTASDPGLHAASEWLLRQWKQETWLKQVNDEWAKDTEQREKRLDGIKRLLAKEKEKTPPQWYVNTQGQTLVVIPGPVEFMMGSPKAEKDRSDDEVQHKRRLGRTFAIASKSVTLEQYRSLTKDPYKLDEKYTRLAGLPVIGIDWYRAAKYCNLLSKEEGFEECYEIKGAQNVVLKDNYLKLTGYRLPTEAEMEYATRAGALTSRYYGETDELLGNYAWYGKNSNELIWPVGTKKPNDLGLFDVQGNCYTWCQEPFDAYPGVEDDQAVEDKEVKNFVVISTERRVLRGGSFFNPASNVRSAYRYIFVPTNRFFNLGFRLARTFTP